MKTKIIPILLVLLVITASLILTGCDLWDNIFTSSAGTTGPGASWMEIPGYHATAQVGGEQLKIQLTAQAR